MSQHVKVVAAVIRNAQGQVLLVRKRGTKAFMNPGGKPEPGESDVQALCRELHEELGLVLHPEQLLPLGGTEAPAANEPGWVITAELYAAPLTGTPQTGQEIEELRWQDPQRPDAPDTPLLAPLTRDWVLPRLRAGSIPLPQAQVSAG